MNVLRHFCSLALVNSGLFLLFILAAGLSGFAWAEKSTHLKEFNLVDDADQLQLEFDFNSTPDYRIFTLKNPERIVLDFKDVSIDEGLSFPVDVKPNIERIRFASRNDGMFRVVLDTAKILKYSEQLVSLDQGFQLRLELNAQSKSAKKKKPSILKKASRTTVTTQVRSIQSQKVKFNNPAPPAGYRDLIVAIDPGHGGKDPGASGRKGTKESKVVLEIAKRLEKLVNEEPGYQAVMTRSKDEFLSLRERNHRARMHKADLFVSIHADAAKNLKARGSSVFVLSSNGASSEAARMLAQRENAVDLLGGVSLKDKEGTLAHVLLDLSQRHTIEVSHKIANSVFKELSKIGKTHAKRVEKAGFVVLKSPDIPSILVETAFISNRSEERRLNSKNYQKKLAKAMMRGIKRYFKTHAADDTVIAQLRKRRHIIRSGDTLSEIARLYRVSLKSLRKYNRLKSDLVMVGQTLKIPVN